MLEECALEKRGSAACVVDSFGGVALIFIVLKRPNINRSSDKVDVVTHLGARRPAHLAVYTAGVRCAQGLCVRSIDRIMRHGAMVSCACAPGCNLECPRAEICV